MPSTMFNILDRMFFNPFLSFSLIVCNFNTFIFLTVLGDYKKVTANNADISFFYIAYQFLMFATGIIGPGFIFIMISGSFSIAFQGHLTELEAYVINSIPLIIFCIACFTMKPDNQIIIAQVLSTVYAVIMVMVYVSEFNTNYNYNYNCNYYICILV